MTYIEPLLTVFFIIAIIGVARKKRKSALAVIGVGGLFLCSWPPADWLFSRPLEMWYPAQPFRAAPAQAIVVFSSGVEPPSSERPYARADEETYQRTEYAAWLYHHWQSAQVLACGGRGGDRNEPFSWTMRRLLQQFGVPADKVLVEEHSRSTHENAVFAAQILRQRGITSVALVVDASSMLRATACLRKAGVRVIPAPSGFRELRSFKDEILPSWKAIRQNERTLHEVGGLLWYSLHGWI